MFILSNRGQRVGDSSTSIKDSDFTTPDGRKININCLIDQANGISLLYIFQEFSIKIDKNNRTTQCPFHKGGNERSPSFWYYPDTNRFHCFGCSKTGLPCDFVLMIKHITKVEASLYILEKYAGLLNSAGELSEIKDIFSDDIILEFSSAIRSFIKNNNYSAEAISFADNLCFSFDKMNEKYSLDHAGLACLVSKLLSRLELYI